MRALVATDRAADLRQLAGLAEAGTLRPVIDASFPLAEAPRGDTPPGGRPRPREAGRTDRGRRLGLVRPIMWLLRGRFVDVDVGRGELTDAEWDGCGRSCRSATGVVAGKGREHRQVIAHGPGEDRQPGRPPAPQPRGHPRTSGERVGAGQDSGSAHSVEPEPEPEPEPETRSRWRPTPVERR
ncbi:hypothetical protein ACIQKB_20015 [Streptomyces sp. NPDC092046]|uniref:hypothetical protein n=1 Tax=Streptomyces sp. NPDC092046 TaxID=3366009 RepID=UPI0038162F65